MEYEKKSGQFSFSDINKSCVLIITRAPASSEKKRLLSLYSRGGVIQYPKLAVYPATMIWCFM